MGWKIAKTERMVAYSSTELEALGVVWAIKHFRLYLYGHKTVVYKDHIALRSLLETPNPSSFLRLRYLMLCDFRYQAFRFLCVAAEKGRKPGDEANVVPHGRSCSSYKSNNGGTSSNQIHVP